MSVSRSTNPSAVKTAIDEVFYPEWNFTEFPYIATANDPAVFNQMSTNKNAEVVEEMKGSGAWEEVNSDYTTAPDSQPIMLYQQTFTTKNLKKGLSIEQSYVDDDMHSSVGLMVRDYAKNGRITRDKDALSIYRTGFTTTGGDSEYLFDTDHPVDGDTESNKLAVALSETNLDTAIVNLGEMKARDGQINGCLPSVLLVPYALFADACRLVDAKAEQRPGTANRDINVFSLKYNVMVKTSPYLGTAAGGDDSYWWLLSRYHGINRYERESINTTLLTPSQLEQDKYFYKGRFRQMTGMVHPFGLIGSSGS